MYSKKKDQAEGVDASVVESSAEGGAYVCGALLETVGKRLARGEIAATNALVHAAKS